MAELATGIFNLLSEGEIAERCVKVAHKYFDLAISGNNGYQNVYRRLMTNKISSNNSD